MGVNMRILHCYGVKKETIDIENKGTYTDNFYELDFENIPNAPVIFDDCYGGGWEFFGQVIDTSHDYRYDGWDTFEWCITEDEENREIDRLCKEFDLGVPKHWIITYYS